MKKRLSPTVLVTGSTDGIGKATALQLAQQGWRVVLHGRAEHRCRVARDEIRKAAENAEIEYLCADLASLAEVRRMARTVHERFGALSVLINNAGVFEDRRKLTVDGIERTLAVNHLTPFLLTGLLLDVLEKNAPARIVNVSSMAHASHLNLDDLQDPDPYSGHEAYAQSKLANILFTRLLAEKIAGRGLTANCLHPGVVGTKLLRSGWGMGGMDVQQGAGTSVYLASSEEVDQISGGYFVDRRIASPATEAEKKKVQERLWDLSEDLCKYRYALK